jgi:hypothetical protein
VITSPGVRVRLCRFQLCLPSTWPPMPTIDIATCSTRTSTARTTAASGDGSTISDGRPAPWRCAGTASVTTPDSASPSTTDLIVLRLSPSSVASVARVQGPSTCSLRSSAARLWRRASSGLAPEVGAAEPPPPSPPQVRLT